MLNQLRSKRNDLRKSSSRFYKIIIDKDEIINFLH